MNRIDQLENCLKELLSRVLQAQVDNGLKLSQVVNDLLQKEKDCVPKGPPKRIPQYLSGSFNEDGEPSIPVGHTTAAHKLLLWPSINKILQPREYDVDYVMWLEKKRGLIRVYGRGEGDETSEGPTISTNLDADVAKMHAPSGPWDGINQLQSKLPDVGLDDAGRVITNPITIRRYYGNYMDHLHKLHPFLDQKDLGQKIERFISTYCPSAGHKMPRGTKRNHSYDALPGAGCVMGSPAPVQAGSNIIEKSIGNAIVLLVLALGSICEVRDRPVPGPVLDYVVNFRQEQIPGHSSSSMLAPAGSEAMAASQSNSIHSNRSSFNPAWMGDGRNLRNLDVIPGLAFYAYATGILGYLQGANGLSHAQASLLAGLYAGQLAHPIQSHGWIFQAARICHVLVESYALPSDPTADKGAN